MPFKDEFTVEEVNLFFSGWVDLFKRQQGITAIIKVDESIAYDVAYRYVDDRKRIGQFNKLESLEITKTMAFLSFWIRKLKPLSYEGDGDPEIENYLNESFGLFVALISCEFDLLFPIKLEGRLLADFLHQFRYKSVSPHSLMIILKAFVTDCRGDKLTFQ